MAVPQLDEINTVTRKRILPGITDNFFKGGPVMAYMKADHYVPYPGGPQIQVNYLYKSLKGKAYKKGEQFDTSKRQTKSGLLFDPRFYGITVPEYMEDIEVLARGPEAVFSLVQTDLSTAALTLSAMLEIDIYKHGQAYSGDDRSACINGLSEALSDGSTASWDTNTYTTYGGETRATVSPALNSPTGLVAGTAVGTMTPRVLEHSYLSCCINDQHPVIGVTTNRCEGFINEMFYPLQRIAQDTVEPTIGWPGMKYKQATILRSQYCPGKDGVNDADLGNYYASAGEVFMWLNPGPKGDDAFMQLHISTSPKYSFGWTGFKVGRDDTYVAGQYLFAGNFTCRAPRFSRILNGITA